jgi:hypothetical protein
MASIRKKYNAPVAYYVHINDIGVHISNKYTAILIFELYISQASNNDVIEMKAIYPPTPWPTWSRSHIVSLLNGCWHEITLGKYTFKNGTLIDVIDYTKSNYKPDHYDQHAIHSHNLLSKGEKQTLNKILSTPELLKLIIQSPTSMSAKLAMKYINSVDTTHIPLSHVVPCWKFLRLQRDGQRRRDNN